MYMKWKIVHTVYKSGWATKDKTELVEYRDVRITRAMGTKKDSFAFNLKNVNGKYNNFFKPLDRVEFYRAQNSESFSVTPFFVGILRDTPNITNATKDELKIQGDGFNAYVLSAITFSDPGGSAMTIPEALKDGLDQASRLNKQRSFRITWNPTNKMVNSEGNAFPLVAERFLYKPLKDLYEKYSTNTMTLDGFYYWYVDINNQLVWKRGVEYPSSTFSIITDGVLEYKYSVDTSKVVNFVVAKGGFSPAGTPIQITERDDESRSRHGNKWFWYISNNNNAGTMNAADMVKSYGTLDAATGKYPDSYPFTTTWVSNVSAVVEGVTMVKGNTVTVSNDTQYNACLRESVKAGLVEEAKSLIQQRTLGLNKLDLTFKVDQKIWGLGDKISCTIPVLSDTAIILRVKEIQHTTTTDMYSLEEDMSDVVV